MSKPCVHTWLIWSGTPNAPTSCLENYAEGGVTCTKCGVEADSRQEHEARREHWGECQDDGETCSECCEHVETDHGICSDCESDVTDMLVGRAEDAFEGDR